MNKGTLLRVALAAAALVAVVWFAFFRDEPAAAGPPGPGGAMAGPPAGGGRPGGNGGGGRPGGSGGGSWGGPGGATTVSTAPVERGAFVVEGQFVGAIQARALADLYAKVQGQVVGLHADTGDRVAAGQLLARIDAADAAERVRQAEAAVRMAQATLAERRAALGIARTTAERTAALWQQQLVAQQQHDAAQAQLQSAAAQVDVARAAVEQARANLGAARVELEKSRIVAPFAGVIGKRYLDLGAFAATNRPVFSIVDLGTVRIAVPLTEKDAARVHTGQTAIVATEAWPDEVFTGRVARLSAVFDPETNTSEAEVEVPNPDGRLKPGMFATVTIAFGTQPDALLVPRSALVEGERETYLFVAQPPAPTADDADDADDAGDAGDGKDRESGGAWTARRVPVERVGTGAERGRADVAVEGPLHEGEQVVTLGQEDLRDGAPIRIAGPDEARGGGRAASP